MQHSQPGADCGTSHELLVSNICIKQIQGKATTKKGDIFLGKSEEITGKFLAKIKILKCNHRRHLIEEK